MASTRKGNHPIRYKGNIIIFQSNDYIIVITETGKDTGAITTAITMNNNFFFSSQFHCARYCK